MQTDSPPNEMSQKWGQTLFQLDNMSNAQHGHNLCSLVPKYGLGTCISFFKGGLVLLLLMSLRWRFGSCEEPALLSV